jgi:hypothetical protein
MAHAPQMIDNGLQQGPNFLRNTSGQDFSLIRLFLLARNTGQNRKLGMSLMELIGTRVSVSKPIGRQISISD